MMKKILLTILFLLFTQNLFCTYEEQKEIKSKKNKDLSLLSNVCRVRLKSATNFLQESNLFFEIKAVNISPLLKKGKNQKNFANKTAQQIQAIRSAEEPLLRTFIVEFDDKRHPEDYCKYLEENFPQIEIAEPYYLDKTQNIPNDPLATSQTMLSRISAFDAWDYSQGDTSIVIGISDNGVYQEHEDLIHSIAPNWAEIPFDGKDNDGNGYIDDFFGYNFAYKEDGTEADYTYNPTDDHGTNVAGIAAASTDNNTGIAGVGYNCRIFPIKAASNKGRSILYGYESILYAAERGFKVLNCSWGSTKPFSEIDQSIIDYAVAKDVLIVAAGGNYENKRTEMWYPAGYYGVIGVGELARNDELSYTSSVGVHTKIMAPGQDNLAPNNKNSYSQLSGGTSFSAPVVAGAAGIIRAKYPELNPLQVIDFIRQCTDDISDLNYEWKDIIPGRLNLLKAMTTDPSTLPGIHFLSANYSKNDGTNPQRYVIGDTLLLSISTFNSLAAADDLNFELSLYGAKNNSVILLDSIISINRVEGNSALTLEPFRIYINSNQSSALFFKISITKTDSDYMDFILFPFVPTRDYVVFQNNALKFSASDKGTIGFGSSREDGIGFLYKDLGNQLYDAGIMATASPNNVLSTLYGWNSDFNDFSTVQPFLAPENNINVIDDSKAIYDEIGIEITQHFHLPNPNSAVAKIFVKVKNKSEETINDLSLGYLFDWDVRPNEDSNKVSLFPEAVPSELTGESIAAECVEYAGLGNHPSFGSIVYSDLENAEAQAAGMDYSIISYFQKSDQMRSLNTGTSIQHSDITDVNYVMGMKFWGEFLPGEEKSFVLCFGGADSKEELANELKECLLNTGVEGSKAAESKELEVELYPNPSSEQIYLSIKTNYDAFSDLKILNIFGNEIAKEEIQLFSGINSFPINLQNYPSGNYILQLRTKNGISISKIITIIK